MRSTKLFNANNELFICLEFFSQTKKRMERIPKSHFCNKILLCHTDWIAQLLANRAVPETFTCHTQFDEDEVEAYLRQV
jgi:hypothetical protein